MLMDTIFTNFINDLLVLHNEMRVNGFFVIPIDRGQACIVYPFFPDWQSIVYLRR